MEDENAEATKTTQVYLRENNKAGVSSYATGESPRDAEIRDETSDEQSTAQDNENAVESIINNIRKRAGLKFRVRWHRF